VQTVARLRFEIKMKKQVMMNVARWRKSETERREEVCASSSVVFCDRERPQAGCTRTHPDWHCPRAPHPLDCCTLCVIPVISTASLLRCSTQIRLQREREKQAAAEEEQRLLAQRRAEYMNRKASAAAAREEQRRQLLESKKAMANEEKSLAAAKLEAVHREIDAAHEEKKRQAREMKLQQAQQREERRKKEVRHRGALSVARALNGACVPLRRC
jgi:hypothetical protein